MVLTLRILAVKYGVRETNTFERIRALQELDLLSPNIGGELEEAYRVLFASHIRNQIESIRLRRGHENFVDPTILSGDEQAQLKYSLLKVELLQKLAHNVFFPGGIGL